MKDVVGKERALHTASLTTSRPERGVLSMDPIATVCALYCWTYFSWHVTNQIALNSSSDPSNFWKAVTGVSGATVPCDMN